MIVAGRCRDDNELDSRVTQEATLSRYIIARGLATNYNSRSTVNKEREKPRRRGILANSCNLLS